MTLFACLRISGKFPPLWSTQLRHTVSPLLHTYWGNQLLKFLLTTNNTQTIITSSTIIGLPTYLTLIQERVQSVEERKSLQSVQISETLKTSLASSMRLLYLESTYPLLKLNVSHRSMKRQALYLSLLQWNSICTRQRSSSFTTISLSLRVLSPLVDQSMD